MSVPDHVRESLRERLWKAADETQWTALSPSSKSASYEAWTRDPSIGGVLSRYISLSDVRVYLKDTLLKDYARYKHADSAQVMRILDLSSIPVVKSYIKPHGRLLADGRVVCWGAANAWKNVLMAAYERAYGDKRAKPFAVVLTSALGQYHQPSVRKMVERAATRLGVLRTVWLE